MSYWSFLARFVLWSAGVFAAWAAFLARWYIAVLVLLGPYFAAATGFGTEFEGKGRATAVYFMNQGTRIQPALPLETASLGLLPFVALVGATAWLPVLRRLEVGAVGTVTFILFHLVLFAVYPFFLTHSNFVFDSLGAFWALLAFGFGFPFLLWVALTRRFRLRSR